MANPASPNLHWAADQKVETLQGCNILVLRELCRSKMTARYGEDLGMGQNPGT